MTHIGPLEQRGSHQVEKVFALLPFGRQAVWPLDEDGQVGDAAGTTVLHLVSKHRTNTFTAHHNPSSADYITDILGVWSGSRYKLLR